LHISGHGGRVEETAANSSGNRRAARLKKKLPKNKGRRHGLSVRKEEGGDAEPEE